MSIGTELEERLKREHEHVTVEKPPLGITPRWRNNEIRMLEIVDAMRRFIEVGKLIPEEWLDEFSDCYRVYEDHMKEQPK